MFFTLAQISKKKRDLAPFLEIWAILLKSEKLFEIKPFLKPWQNKKYLKVDIILYFWFNVHFASGKCIPWADQGILWGKYDLSITVKLEASNISKYDFSFSPSNTIVTKTPSSSSVPLRSAMRRVHVFKIIQIFR